MVITWSGCVKGVFDPHMRWYLALRLARLLSPNDSLLTFSFRLGAPPSVPAKPVYRPGNGRGTQMGEQHSIGLAR